MTLNIWSKTPITRNIPPKLRNYIKILRKTKSREECLRKAYSILTAKYKGYRLLTYLKINQIFETDIDKIWNKCGFLHCTQLNYLLRLLLVKSGHFKDSDVNHKWTLIWYISSHQYSTVKISKNKSVNVDIWGKKNGIKYGNYAHGLN